MKQFSSKVISGKKHGRTIGYPTANLEVTNAVQASLNQEGVYAVQVEYQKKQYCGALFWGKRTLFADTAPVCEVLLLDFKEEVYGELLTIHIIDFIRPTKQIHTSEELRLLMQSDIQQAQRACVALDTTPI